MVNIDFDPTALAQKISAGKLPVVISSPGGEVLASNCEEREARGLTAMVPTIFASLPDTTQKYVRIGRNLTAIPLDKNGKIAFNPMDRLAVLISYMNQEGFDQTMKLFEPGVPPGYEFPPENYKPVTLEIPQDSMSNYLHKKDVPSFLRISPMIESGSRGILESLFNLLDMGPGENVEIGTLEGPIRAEHKDGKIAISVHEEFIEGELPALQKYLHLADMVSRDLAGSPLLVTSPKGVLRASSGYQENAAKAWASVASDYLGRAQTIDPEVNYVRIGNLISVIPIDGETILFGEMDQKRFGQTVQAVSPAPAAAYTPESSDLVTAEITPNGKSPPGVFGTILSLIPEGRASVEIGTQYGPLQAVYENGKLRVSGSRQILGRDIVLASNQRAEITILPAPKPVQYRSA